VISTHSFPTRALQHTCCTSVAPMDFADNQTHLQPPGLGFELLHFQRRPFFPNSPLMTYHLGTFTSLTHAREAAGVALQSTLDKYLDEGYHGRYCKEIDLTLRGVITVYADIVVDGYSVTKEFWLDEFHLGTVQVWDASWDAEVRRSGEDALFYSPSSEVSDKMQVTKRPKPVVKLPLEPRPTTPKPSPPTPIPRQALSISEPEGTPQLSSTGVEHPEEQQNMWSNSRPPLPMSASQPLPPQVAQHEEERQLEWSRTRPS